MLGLLASPPRLLRPFLGIGVLGGFTTFSTFALDAERLIRAHRPGVAALYVLATLVAGAVAVTAATAAVQRGHQIAGRARVRRADPAGTRPRATADESGPR